jgi:DNA adenine methylase
MTITPFRYPGAKNKTLPILDPYLDTIISGQKEFVDVFVGGGSVLLHIAKKYKDIKLYANDKDYWMYCIWSIVAGSDSSKLGALLDMLDTQPTLELFYKLRGEPTTDEIACAYRAIFFNRTTFSGIFYSGPIGGKDQKSQYKVDCRYNSKKLKTKILDCNKLLVGRTVVSNKDFADLDVLIKSDIPAYIDPPYVDKGDSLYIEKMNLSQHMALGKILSSRKNWVASYDDHISIRDLYKDKQIIDLKARYCINGEKNSWEHKNELVILS